MTGWQEFHVRESGLLAPDTLLVVSPEPRVRLRELVALEERPDAPWWEQERSSFLFEARMSLVVGGLRPERDPLESGPATSPGALLRQMGAVVGYEFRQAAGRPRMVSTGAQPHGFVMVTGLTS